MDQQPSVLSHQNEGSNFIFVVGSQDKVMLQGFQDPFSGLLQALEKINVVLFVSISLCFSFYCELPTCTSFCLLEESKSGILVSIHLLDWLH